MERTFEELYTELVSETGDDSAAKLVEFKRWLNRAVSQFQTKLRIQFTEQERTVTATATQRYQAPEDSNRIIGIRFYDGDRTLPLSEIVDDKRWQRMNATSVTGVPTHYHKIAEDLYELYPIPSGTYVNGIILNCRISQKQMYAANYTTGTASVSTDGQIIMGSGTTFTAAMIGRRFRWVDGTGNGIWYRISGRSSNTSITLENFYSDTAVSAGSFIIAEIPELPIRLHDAVYDYAYWRWLLGKREMAAAREFKAIWEDAVNGYQPEDDSDQQVYGPEPEPYIDDNVMQVMDTVI